MQVLLMIATIILCYLLGNVNFALIISKFLKTDIRKLDSGNPGAMNMTRNFGKRFGALTLFLDALKGATAAAIGWLLMGKGQFLRFGSAQLGLYIGALSVIVGHIFPIFLKFKGGKGIASSVGICFFISPLITLITFLCGLLFITITKLGAITSFIIITIPLALKAYEYSTGTVTPNNIVVPILIFCIFMLTLTAHRKNIVKLFKGKESKTVLIKPRKASPKI